MPVMEASSARRRRPQPAGSDTGCDGELVVRCEHAEKRDSAPAESHHIGRSLSTCNKTKSFPNGGYNSLNFKKRRQITYTRHYSSEQSLRDRVKKAVLEGRWLCVHDLAGSGNSCCGETTERHRKKEILQFQLVQFEVVFNMEITDLVNLAKRAINWDDLDIPKYLKRNIAATVDEIKKTSNVMLHEFDCIWKEKGNFSSIYIMYQKYMDKYDIYIRYSRDLQKLREMLYGGKRRRAQVSETKMSEIFGIERDLLPVFHLSLICYILGKLKKEPTLKQLDQFHCCRSLSQLLKVEEECCKLVSKLDGLHSTAYSWNKDLGKKCKQFADEILDENKCLSENDTSNDKETLPATTSNVRASHHVPDDCGENSLKNCEQDQSNIGWSATTQAYEKSTNIAVCKKPVKPFNKDVHTPNKIRNEKHKIIQKSETIKSSNNNLLAHLTDDSKKTLHENISDKPDSLNSGDNLIPTIEKNNLLYPYRRPVDTVQRNATQTVSETYIDKHRHVKIFGSFLNSHHSLSINHEVTMATMNSNNDLNTVMDRGNEMKISAENTVSEKHTSKSLLEAPKIDNDNFQPYELTNDINELNADAFIHRSVGTQTKDCTAELKSYIVDFPLAKAISAYEQPFNELNFAPSTSEKETKESQSLGLTEAVNMTLIETINCKNIFEPDENCIPNISDYEMLNLVEAVNIPIIKETIVGIAYVSPNDICEAVNDFAVCDTNTQEYSNISEDKQETYQNSMFPHYENRSEISNNTSLANNKDLSQILFVDESEISNISLTSNENLPQILFDDEPVTSEDHPYENLFPESQGILLRTNYEEEHVYENVLHNSQEEFDFTLRSLGNNSVRQTSRLSLRKLQRLRESFRSNKQKSSEEETYNDVEFEQLSHAPLYQNFSFSSLPVYVDDGEHFIVSESEPADSSPKEAEEVPYEDMTFTMRWKTRLQDNKKLPTRKRHHGFRTRWQQTDEVIKSGILDSLTEEEKKLQEAKFEIITSELSYYKSLCILEHMFAENETLKNIQILPHKDREILFSQVKPVKICSQNFLKDLITVWEKDLKLTAMADTIIYHADNSFGAYVKYCENLQIIEKRLRHLMKNRRFATALKKIEDDEKCEKFPLYSFLMLPMQRATRFQILAEAVLKYMQSPNEEYDRWVRAFERLHSLAEDCNSSVKIDDESKNKKSEETPFKKFFLNRYKLKKILQMDSSSVIFSANNKIFPYLIWIE